MDTPEDFEAWTFDTIRAIVTRHEYEPGTYDYKEVLNASGQGKGEHAASIRRTVCSMANGDGGYIIFGVKDRASTSGERIVGIPNSADLRKEFSEKIEHIERDVYFDTVAIPLPADTMRSIFVVHIPSSPLRPHLDTSDGHFYIRGEGGKAKRMNFTHIRDQMLYSEGRLQKVRLLRFELATFVSVLKMLNAPSTRVVRFETSAFKVLLADVADLLQPDSGLLALLHTIATDASALNYILNREDGLRMTPTEPPIAGWPQSQVFSDLIERIGQLHKCCGEAQDRLTTLFGPLPTS